MSHGSFADRLATVERLSRAIAAVEQGTGSRRVASALSTGCLPFDAILPGGGIRLGTLWEFMGENGSGARLLALSLIRVLLQERESHAKKYWCVIDSDGSLFPPALSRMGLDIQGLYVVRPESERDFQWSIDQALRCDGLGAVLARPTQIDDRTFRRWQLAVEQSGATGFLIRPPCALRAPSFAEARLLVASRRSPSHERHLQVSVIHARGGIGQQCVDVVIDNDRGFLPQDTCSPNAGRLAAELAHSETLSGQARIA